MSVAETERANLIADGGPDRYRLWAERRALTVLVVRHLDAAPADDSANGHLAYRRADSLAACDRNGGIRIAEHGIWSHFAFGLATGGRRPMASGMRCAEDLRRNTSGSPAGIGIEVGIATVWRTEGGTLCLATGSVVETAASLAERGGMHVGPLLSALASRRTPAAAAERDVLQLLVAGRLLAQAGTAHAVLRTLAVIGEPVSRGDLAAALDLAQSTIERHVETLISQGLVSASTSGGDIGMNSSVRRKVLWTIPDQDRRRIAQCYADHLATTLAGERSPALARRAARAYEMAEAWDVAWRFWREAAALATQAGRQSETLMGLRRAQRLAGRLGRPAEHVAVAAELANVLGSMRGNADPEVVRTYRACLTLCRRMTIRSAQEFDVRYGLQASHLVRGEIGEARALGLSLIDMAADSMSAGQLSAAHRLFGLTLLLDGDLDGARRHYRTSLRHYETAPQTDQRARFGSDQKALALAGLSWLECFAGASAASADLAREAEMFARTLDHPHTSAHVGSILAVRSQILDETEAAGRLAGWVNAVAAEHELTYWHAWSEAILGWADWSTGKSSGIQRLDRAIDRYRETGSAQALPFMLAMRAKAQTADGALAAASVTLARAERDTRKGGVRLFRPEILRAAAGVARRLGDRPAALRLARKAYRTAVGQGAGLFCSLAVSEIAATAAGSDVGRIARTVKSRLN